ncbi:metallophosphoesterase [Ideonella sp.]|uniref:metallophosphoesterase family protein n=1 Tax=Ideonella sp. TaxID=1929293 RepID=UPI0035B11A82
MSPPVRLLQVSDAHFGTESPEMVAALRHLVNHLAPEWAVWTGDITQRARRAQFDAARRFIDSLWPVRSVATPGNHDLPLFNLPGRLLRPYGGFRRAFGGELEPVIDRPGLLLVMVDTTRRWRHQHGELSPAQIDWVARRLAGASPGQWRLVATHQPLHEMAYASTGRRRPWVRRGEQALSVWAEAGADLLLAGHTHHPGCFPLRRGGRDLWLVQGGTSLSHRVRGGEPNSVNLMSLGTGDTLQGEVQRWDHDPRDGHFRCVERVALAPSR